MIRLPGVLPARTVVVRPRVASAVVDPERIVRGVTSGALPGEAPGAVAGQSAVRISAVRVSAVRISGIAVPGAGQIARASGVARC